ncbi:MAG: hypothetical protein LIP02_09230 [Bacteroidales bacterium]|nr:hypothetical protein [Bacteroidales bacterium]
MKKLLTFVCLSIFCPCWTTAMATSTGLAADQPKTVKTGKSQASAQTGEDNVIHITIPKKLNIKDKVFLVNKTKGTIEKAAIVLEENGTTTTVGFANNVGPGDVFEVASYQDNKLKKLKGKNLLIKIKGEKAKGENQGGVSTYDYKVDLSEKSHDLYITVTSSGNPLDF